MFHLPCSFLFIIIIFINCCSPSLPKSSAATDDPFTAKRKAMVAIQLKARDIIDPKVLQAMETTPRHLFMNETLWLHAYSDQPLPIGEGQTISQPYVVAYMTQTLELDGNERVLEIGTGSGYQAAVLSPLVKEVYTIEIRPKLADAAGKKLAELKYTNVKNKAADGYFGWEEFAPFDAIMITAAVNHVPPPLLKQLKPGGKLILPLGSTDFFQTLTLITKTAEGKPEVEHLIDVRFVPMTGKVGEEK